jgi:PhnB protein
MQVNPYLNFEGHCEAAFTFYAQVLGGQVGTIFRYAGTKLAAHVPADWQDKVMHGSVTVGGMELMGADVARDRYEAPKGFSLSIHLTDTTEAARLPGTQHGRPDCDGAREDLLGRSVWHGRRSVRDVVDGQLRVR